MPVTQRNRLFTHTGISVVIFCFLHRLAMLKQPRERRLFSRWKIKMKFQLVTVDLCTNNKVKGKKICQTEIETSDD
jgi:hypothetical protein